MKILILYSGGLDSLVMARYAELNFPDAEVIKLWYDIGQPYNYKERAALPNDVIVRDLPWLGANASLVQGKGESFSGDIYIPGRNLALAVNAACQFLPDRIWMGALQGEIHAGATDKNYTFLHHVNSTLNYVLSPFTKSIQVEFPLADAGFGKFESVEWALNSGVPPATILASSSCLSGELGNCGHCVVCLRRWGIFKQLGLEEDYNVDPLSVRENRQIINEMLTGDYYDGFRKREILPALTDQERQDILSEFAL